MISTIYTGLICLLLQSIILLGSCEALPEDKTKTLIKEGPALELIVSKGSNVTLPCKTEGEPAPVISWTVNGTVITNSDKYLTGTDSGNLIIKDATEEDEGTYKCTATNQVMSDTAEGTLLVRSIATIVDGPTDRREQVFSSIEMRCEAVTDVSRELSFTWEKNNVKLGQPGFLISKRVYQDSNQSLVLKNLTFDDSGSYACVANDGLNDDSASGLLTVVGIKPRVSLSNKIMDLLVGVDVSILCEVSLGTPKPSVKWYNDKEVLTMENVHVDEDNTLFIQNIQREQAGDYVCTAENNEGLDSDMVEVNVRNKTVILSEPVHQLFEEDSEVSFDCEVEVDSALLGGLNIQWFKNGVNLDLIQAPEPPQALGETIIQVEEPPSPCEFYDPNQDARMYMLTNSTLRICSLNISDIGEYYCQVTTNLERSIISKKSTVYITPNFPWWILLLLLLLLLLVMLGCLAFYFRRRKLRKGYYNMDSETGHKKNKSDIYYIVEGSEHNENEEDKTKEDGENTSSCTPKSIKHVATVDTSIGSISTLLDIDDTFDKMFVVDVNSNEKDSNQK